MIDNTYLVVQLSKYISNKVEPKSSNGLTFKKVDTNWLKLFTYKLNERIKPCDIVTYPHCNKNGWKIIISYPNRMYKYSIYFYR